MHRPFVPRRTAAVEHPRSLKFAGAIADEAVTGLAAALGSRAAVALLVALAFFDVQCRWKLVFDLAAQAMPKWRNWRWEWACFPACPRF